MEEKEFKNYKEKQNYYRELYKNRGKVIHISKIIDKTGKVLQNGSTYESNKGDIRAAKRKAAFERRYK